jgi:hypothetical protein
LKRLENILQQFEVTLVQAKDMVLLEEYRVVILADDSGSMRQEIHNAESEAPFHLEKLSQKQKDVLKRLLCKEDQARFDGLEESKQKELLKAVERPPTRFSEVENACKFLVEICGCFRPVDVFFMNRGGPKGGVKSMDDEAFQKCWNLRPAGCTPMMDRLMQVINGTIGELPVLLFILTDGSMESDEERERVKDYLLKAVSTTRSAGGPAVRVQLMTCTEDFEETQWIDDLEQQSDRIDAIDDYAVELRQVLKAAGTKEAERTQQFTRGDWVIKAILGPLSKDHDNLDESKFHRSRRQVIENIVQNVGCNCVIS